MMVVWPAAISTYTALPSDITVLTGLVLVNPLNTYVIGLIIVNASVHVWLRKLHKAEDFYSTVEPYMACAYSFLSHYPPLFPPSLSSCLNKLLRIYSE